MQTHSAPSARPRKTPTRRQAGTQPFERSCFICRRCTRQDNLWPLRGLPLPRAGLSPQVNSFKPGRGAYICISAKCLAAYFCRQAAKTSQSAAQLWVHTLAQQRLLSLLGLARRCGQLVHGVERVAAEPAARPEEKGRCIIAAGDLSARSQRQLESPGIFVEADALGAATGLGSVGALCIRSGRLSLQAASWFTVWYDTRTAMLANINSHSAIEVAR